MKTKRDPDFETHAILNVTKTAHNNTTITKMLKAFGLAYADANLGILAREYPFGLHSPLVKTYLPVRYSSLTQQTHKRPHKVYRPSLKVCGGNVRA
jgi:hypothetical protein